MSKGNPLIAARASHDLAAATQAVAQRTAGGLRAVLDRALRADPEIAAELAKDTTDNDRR